QPPAPADKPDAKPAPAKPVEGNQKAPAEETGTKPAVKKVGPEKGAEKAAAPAPPVAPPAAPGVVGRPAIGVAARTGMYPEMRPNQILLMDGKGKLPPTYYAGAIRIRAVPNPNQPPGGVESPLSLSLQVAVEPKMQLR